MCTYHDGGSGRSSLSPSPALSNVGALGFLAHRGQAQPPQVFLEPVEVLPNRDVGLQPWRQSQSLSFLSLEVVRSQRSCLDEFAQTGPVSYHLHLLWSQGGLPAGGDIFQPLWLVSNEEKSRSSSRYLHCSEWSTVEGQHFCWSECKLAHTASLEKPQLQAKRTFRRWASIRTALLWCAFIGIVTHVGKDRRGEGREGAVERSRS